MSNDIIVALKGADRVRKRPAVIFGSVGSEGVTNAIKDVLRIFIGEAAQKFCNKIAITLRGDNSVLIKSYDRGFDLSEELIDGEKAWRIMFCELYAPLRNKTSDYVFGLCDDHERLYGEGTSPYAKINSSPAFDITAVQYVCEYMNVRVSREGSLKTLSFKKGECTKELAVCPTDEPSYTELDFKLDAEVFETNAPLADGIKAFMKNACVTVPALVCEYKNEHNGEEGVFSYKNGLGDYLEELCNGKTKTQVFFKEYSATGKDRYNKKEYTADLVIALCFCKNVSEIGCFHNHELLQRGGTHLDAIKDRIMKHFNWMLGDDIGKEYGFDDISKHLVLLVETKCIDTMSSWENATQETLNNVMITDMAFDVIDGEFGHYLKENRDSILSIIKE